MPMSTECTNYLSWRVILVDYGAFVCETKLFRYRLLKKILRRISREQRVKCVASAIAEPAYTASFILYLRSGRKKLYTGQDPPLAYTNIYRNFFSSRPLAWAQCFHREDMETYHGPEYFKGVLQLCCGRPRVH